MNRRLVAAGLVLGIVATFAASPGALAAKKKKKPKAPACAAYEPGDQGADAGDTIIVNDVATEETPVEIPVDVAPGLGLTGEEPTISHVYKNIQVDTKLPETGLYVRFEFNNTPAVRDYDIWLNYADGSNASNAHGFNPAPDSQFSPQSDGGHSETNAEQIDGTHSADCQGYTLDIATVIGEGGDFKLKLWLGEIQYHPGG